jgi:predicted nicotinamide N-methyase
MRPGVVLEDPVLELPLFHALFSRLLDAVAGAGFRPGEAARGHHRHQDQHRTAAHWQSGIRVTHIGKRYGPRSRGRVEPASTGKLTSIIVARRHGLMLHRLPPLPTLQGGWKQLAFDLPDRKLEIILPGEPDHLLDDPDVIAANQRDDYMPYWSYLWPAAAPFATALQSAPWPRGTEVLDLGSGIGLTGVAGLARGDRVIFSDYAPQSLLLCRHNAVRNGFDDPETLLLDWRQPLDRQFRIITGCEVTYEKRNHQPLIALLQTMLTPGPPGKFQSMAWIADPGRYHAPGFVDLARRSGFFVTILDENLDEHPAPRSNAFQIIQLVRS